MFIAICSCFDANWLNFCFENDNLPEVGKAQLEAQSATSATSAIAEVALRFNVLF